MLREKAEVVSRCGSQARIRIHRNSACSQCRAQSACYALDPEARIVEFSIPDPLNTSVGDTVEIVIRPRSVLTASSLAFLLPVLGLLAGALIGNLLAQNLQLPNDISVLSGATLLLVLSLLALIPLARSIGSRPDFQPKISRILQRDHSPGLVPDTTRIFLNRSDQP